MVHILRGIMFALILVALAAGSAKAEEGQGGQKADLRSGAKALQENVRNKVNDARDAAKTQLETRLKAFKDQKKREIVARVADKFGDINLRITDNLQRGIEKIEAFTTK